MNYSVILKYSSTDQCYIISVPDLPGCMADGNTPNEAYENIKIVMEEYIETAHMEAVKFLNHLLEMNYKKGQHVMLPQHIIFFCFQDLDGSGISNPISIAASNHSLLAS